MILSKKEISGPCGLNLSKGQILSPSQLSGITVIVIFGWLTQRAKSCEHIHLKLKGKKSWNPYWNTGSERLLKLKIKLN